MATGMVFHWINAKTQVIYRAHLFAVQNKNAVQGDLDHQIKFVWPEWILPRFIVTGQWQISGISCSVNYKCQYWQFDCYRVKPFSIFYFRFDLTLAIAQMSTLLFFSPCRSLKDGYSILRFKSSFIFNKHILSGTAYFNIFVSHVWWKSYQSTFCGCLNLSHGPTQLCMLNLGSGNCNSWGQSVGINHAVGQLSVYVYSTLLPM